MTLRGGVWDDERVAVVISQLILCLMLAMITGKVGSTPLPEEAKNGGVLVLGVPAEQRGPERAQQIPILLRRYNGSDVTALQLTVVCDWPYRVEGVKRGPAVDDSSRWRLFSEVRSGIGKGTRHGADTIRIVLLSTSLAGLGPGDETGLLWLAIRPPAPQQAGGASQASVHITEVVGALYTGTNADISAGPSRVLMDHGTQR